MKRWIAFALLAVLGVTAFGGYVALRREDQYRTFIAVGDQAVAADDAFGAIEAFSGAIALRPSSMLAWLKRGEVYLRRGDHRSAVRDLRRAVDLDPAATRPLDLLGDSHMALERHARAAEQFEAYLRLDDRDARVFYKLALARMYDGRIDAAVAAATRSLRLEERVPDAHYLLGLCLAQMQRPREALKAFERAVELDPARVTFREALADRYRLAGRVTDEVRQLEAISALDPGQPGRHISVANAWARGGRTDLAVTTLVRALERFDDDARLLLAVGRIWLNVAEARQDRVALGKALEALRRSSGLSPSGAALSALGHAQLLAGDTVGAFRSLQQATAALPVQTSALADLAAAAERLGRHAAARDALIKEATLLGERGSPRLRADRAVRIANVSQRMGDRQAEVDWLERALAATPDDRSLATRLGR